MTRPRDDRNDANGGAAEPQELQDAAFADAANDDDDSSLLLPLLDAESGPARPLSEREMLVFADRIERQFLAQRTRPRSRLSPRRLLLAGGLFAASAAAAVYGVGVARRAAEPALVQPAAVQPAVVQSVVVPPAESAARPAVVKQPPADEAAPAQPAVLEPVADQRESRPGRRVAERSAEPQAPQAQLVAPKLSDSVPSADSATRSFGSGAAARQNRTGASPRQNKTVAADRLAAANSLRSRHRYREALALYLQVIEIAPNGMQASVARVAAAEMQLEQFGDIAGAERLYRDARTQGGELTTEAQFGLAQVARARGDAAGERRALQDFLGRHPESPLAAAARRRLDTLGAR